MCCEKRTNGGSDGSEEQAEVGGQLATRGHCDVQAQAVAKGCVWVCVPSTPTVCVALQQRPQEWPVSGAATGGHVAVQEPY